MHKKASVKHIDLTNFDFFHLKVFIYARFYGTIITIRTMISNYAYQRKESEFYVTDYSSNRR